MPEVSWDSSRAELRRALLTPASVAVVGASDDPRKATARPLQFLRTAGFSGRVYPVNSRRSWVLGEPAWRSLAALPEVPDHAFIAVDRDLVVECVEECGQLGVPLVTVLADGFAGEGPGAQSLGDELLATAAKHGVRVIGPNSIGLACPENGLLLTANAAFAEPAIPIGGTFVASQSGSVIGALMTRAKARGIGFAGLVSTGSEIDLTLGELCSLVIDHPSVDSFALFLESLQNAPDLLRFAALAEERSVPVTIYKLGRTDAAAKLSVTHTGALAGSDADADAFFNACGFVRVDNFEALFETAALQLQRPVVTAGRPPRVAVLTGTGGGAAILVDQLAQRGVNVTQPSADVFERIRAAGVQVTDNLIVDLTLAGTQHEKVKAVLAAVDSSGEFDLIAVTIGSSARLNPELAVQAMVESVPLSTPIVAWLLPDALGSLAMLSAAGIASYRTVESAAESVAAVFARRTCDRSALAIDPRPHDEAGHPLDEVASGAILRRLGVRFPESEVVELGRAPSDRLTYPVAVKGLSSALQHKSDVGAVVLHVPDAAGVVGACHRIAESVAESRPEVTMDRFLVQEMVDDAVVEMLVGYRQSETVGPVLTLSAGGTNVELYQDVAVRLAPITRQTAAEMIDEVKAMRLARGFRGRTPGDEDALADLLVTLSRSAVEDSSVLEAEVNPVAVRPVGLGVVALDALASVSNEVNVEAATEG